MQRRTVQYYGDQLILHWASYWTCSAIKCIKLKNLSDHQIEALSLQ